MFSYQGRDVSSIQDDLNKLYDTRPTTSTESRQHDRKTSSSRQTRQRHGDSSSGRRSTEEDEHRAPYFDLSYSRNVTAVLGKTAILNCRVVNIGNKTVRRAFMTGNISCYTTIIHAINGPSNILTHKSLEVKEFRPFSRWKDYFLLCNRVFLSLLSLQLPT